MAGRSGGKEGEGRHQERQMATVEGNTVTSANPYVQAMELLGVTAGEVVAVQGDLGGVKVRENSIW